MTPASLSWKCVVADACYQNQLAVKPVSVRFAKGKSVPRHARLRPAVTATGSAAQSSNGSDGQSIQQAQSVPGDPRQSASQAPSRGITQRLKKFFKGDKMDMQRLKALGLGAVASYGCVSNVTYGTGLAISWITFVQQTGEQLLSMGLQRWLSNLYKATIGTWCRLPS